MNEQHSADLVALESAGIGMILGCVAAGAVLIWFGVFALDPSWTAGPAGGHGWIKFALEAIVWLTQHASPLVSGSILIGLGLLCLAFAVLCILHGIYWREPQLIVDANGIESRSDDGKGRLAWAEIVSVRVNDGVLRVNGSGGADISVATGDIDKTANEIFAAIARHRPELLPTDSRLATA
jgi:hypothetical protein